MSSGQKRDYRAAYCDGIAQNSVLRFRERGLETWADNVSTYMSDLATLVETPEYQRKIEKREQAGLTAIVMPGRDTQRKNWYEAMMNLKPISSKKALFSKKRIDKRTEVVIRGYQTLMNNADTYVHLPEGPYILWSKVTKSIDPQVKGVLGTAAQKLITQMHLDDPDLYDPHGIFPTEYGALGYITTVHEASLGTLDIRPLDTSTIYPNISSTIFAELSNDGVSPCVSFTDGYLLYSCEYDHNLQSAGIRAVTRT